MASYTRFDYARYKTRERAEMSLEDSFASGDISQGDRPLIEPRRDHNGRILYWSITLPM